MATPPERSTEPAPIQPEAEGRWTVSTRSVGELLTTDIRGDQLRVLLFSRPGGQAHFAVRIAGLLDDAADTAENDSGPRPIPPLLHHTMQVVVELIQDLAESSGEPAAAIAFYGSAREVAFAHAGGETVALESPQGPVEAAWFPLGEVEDGAVRAQAFSLLSRPDLDVRLRWSYVTEDEAFDGVEAEAQWKGPSNVAVMVRTLAGEVVSSAHTGKPGGRGAFFAGWFDAVVGPPAVPVVAARDDEAEWDDADSGAESEPQVYDVDPDDSDPAGDVAYEEEPGDPAEDDANAAQGGDADWSGDSDGVDADEGVASPPPATRAPTLPAPPPPSVPSTTRVKLATPAWEWPPRFDDLEADDGADDAGDTAASAQTAARAQALAPAAAPESESTGHDTHEPEVADPDDAAEAEVAPTPASPMTRVSAAARWLEPGDDRVPMRARDGRDATAPPLASTHRPGLDALSATAGPAPREATPSEPLQFEPTPAPEAVAEDSPRLTGDRGRRDGPPRIDDGVEGDHPDDLAFVTARAAEGRGESDDASGGDAVEPGVDRDRGAPHHAAPDHAAPERAEGYRRHDAGDADRADAVFALDDDGAEADGHADDGVHADADAHAVDADAHAGGADGHAGGADDHAGDADDLHAVEAEGRVGAGPTERPVVTGETSVAGERERAGHGADADRSSDVPSRPRTSAEDVTWNVRDLGGAGSGAHPRPAGVPARVDRRDVDAEAAAARAELLRQIGAVDLMKLGVPAVPEPSPGPSAVVPAAPLASPEGAVADAPGSRVLETSRMEPPITGEATPPTSAPGEEHASGTWFAPIAPDEEAVATVPAPRVPRRVAWPELHAPRHGRRTWMRRAPWIAGLAALFAIGWWIGVRPGAPAEGLQRSMTERLLIAVGLGGPRYTLHLTSIPLGAKVSVDGKPTHLKTPADLDLKVGAHQITLTVPEYGNASFDVTGTAGQRVNFEAPLSGSLQVMAPSTGPPIEVTLDGIPQGYAPLRIMQLDPGPHEVEFTAPGQPTWAQTIRVPVRGLAEVTARPFELPPTGLLEVRATYTDGEGSEELRGATVYVDGERRGTTPLSLELTRGPHSVRASYRDEHSGIQVLDLPGGNQRYANFSFGLGSAPPRLELDPVPAGAAAAGPKTVSVRLSGVPRKDLREMWLHVRTREGTWRRYAMSMLDGPTGASGMVAFPPAAIDPSGQTQTYYVSALSTQGEEYFTELQSGRARPIARVVPPRGSRPAAAETGPSSSAASGPGTP